MNDSYKWLEIYIFKLKIIHQCPNINQVEKETRLERTTLILIILFFQSNCASSNQIRMKWN